VGKATAFERSDDGVISAEIELTPEELPVVNLEDVNRHIEIANVKVVFRDDVETVVDGVLRGIFLSADPHAWPSLDVRTTYADNAPDRGEEVRLAVAAERVADFLAHYDNPVVCRTLTAQPEYRGIDLHADDIRLLLAHTQGESR
jgi:hypothetical protein